MNQAEESVWDIYCGGGTATTLNTGALGTQMIQLGKCFRERLPDQGSRLDRALGALLNHADDFELLAIRARSHNDRRNPPFRAGIPLQRLNHRQPPVSPPADYAVLATDGSQIEPDSHGAASCYLINIGWAALRYGSEPEAHLGSQPDLRFSDDDLYIGTGDRRVRVEGNLLGTKRHVAETQRLADLVEELAFGVPIVGLQDGTLLLSASGRGEETFIWRDLLAAFLKAIDIMREAGVPLAAYTSQPRSTDLGNLLRLATCPYPDWDCQKWCADRTANCADLAGLPDRSIVDALGLAPGERSALFQSPWRASLDYYGIHKIYFFYEHTGSELTRVEIPEWVARDDQAVTTIQGVLSDQCHRGQGYPRVLIEAHEQAVVTAAERRIFAELLERTLVANGLPSLPSQKARSKRLRTL